tara:strand:- start:1244 stop:2224 length:981 start_codon:yes stop_codon:yes gene_type:complete
MISLVKIKDYLNSFSIKNDINSSDNTIINNIGSLKNSKTGEITFFNDKSLISFLNDTKASYCFIKEEYAKYLSHNCKPIVVENPYLAYAHISNLFYPKKVSNSKISNSCFINKKSNVGNNVQINNFVTINENTTLKDNIIIFENSIIGPNVLIGENTIIHSGCIVANADIGKNSLIQSGVVIGDRGFGFTAKEKVEIAHFGKVIIGDNVEIGSNTTIDRAAIDSTIINDNVRIDNLVQIAHNVNIGQNTIIAAQTGIAGSAVIGRDCLIGGQVGIKGHITIGDNVTIAAKSGVTKNIKSNSIIAGFPAIDIRLWKRNIIKSYKKIK